MQRACDTAAPREMLRGHIQAHSLNLYMLQSLRSIAGYRLVAALGKGGMARVFLALSQKSFGFSKLVVLKVLREELEGEFVDMFVQEARIAARLNHPNVVQTYEVGEDAGRHYIAMEYLEGQAVSAVLQRVGLANVPLDFQLRILCDALEGLQYAHDLVDFDGTPLGLIHRDVSPQNIFVTYTGQAKILDFGIAKTSSSTRTAQGILKGKSGYMAPEQVRCAELDQRCDTYAIGVVLWEALAQRRLVLRNEDDVAALMRRASGQDPKVRDVAPDADPELADICDKAMAPDPADRFASARQFREALEQVLSKRSSYDARRVATLLDEAFAEERTAIRRMVEAESKRAATAGPLPDLQEKITRRPGALPAEDEPSSSPTSPTGLTQMSGAQAFATGEATPALHPKRRVGQLVAVGTLLVAGILVGTQLLARPHASGVAAPPPAPLQGSLAPASPLASAAVGEVERYRLTVTSEPAGARVYEGNALLGGTPLKLTLDNGDLHRSTRTFTVRADGYEAATVVPALSNEDVTTHVLLRASAPDAQAVRPGHRTAAGSGVAAPRGSVTRPTAVDPPDPRGLRPLDDTNPWEKKR